MAEQAFFTACAMPLLPVDHAWSTWLRGIAHLAMSLAMSCARYLGCDFFAQMTSHGGYGAK